MDNSLDGMKSLVINGVEYGKYLMEKDLLFLNIKLNIVPNDISQSEDFMAMIISMIEQKKFLGIAYLNLDAKH